MHLMTQLSPILFHADPRWLGSGLANDFSLFGAQPAMFFALAPQNTDGATPSVAGPSAPEIDDPQAAPPVARGEVGSLGVADASPPSAAASPIVSGSRAGADPEPMAAPPSPSLAEPAMPPASGAGLSASGESSHAADRSGAGSPSAADDVSDASLSASLLQVPMAVGPIASVVDIVPAVTSGILQNAGKLVDGLTDTLADGVEGLPLDALMAAPAALLGGVGSLVEGVSEGLPIHDLLGSDPVAGVATLVNLVTVSDVIDLQDAGAPADLSLAGSGSPLDQLLDTLTAEPILLPDPFDDDDPASGALPIEFPDLGLGL